MHSSEKAGLISKCLQLAILLEASSYKPGNVTRTSGFKCTRYEHFLASAVATNPSLEYAAERGIAVSKGGICVSEVELGVIIKDCVVNVNAWQHGGNTLLGTIILLSPIAVAGGMTSAEAGIFKISRLRENVKLVVEQTGAEDAANVYEAIKIASPGGLGIVPELDVNDPNSINKILKEKISLYRIFKIAEKYDAVCSEWVNNYPLTFDVAFPSLDEQLNKGEDLNTAIVHTFLELLAERPDTLIARKAGVEKAREVSSMAREVLKLGELETSRGNKSLSELDRKLKKSSNLLNPGTTADIIAASLSLCLLSGYRP
jgi:triphosphoribosyl-dephospho-CoA synthase